MSIKSFRFPSMASKSFSLRVRFVMTFTCCIVWFRRTCRQPAAPAVELPARWRRIWRRTLRVARRAARRFPSAWRTTCSSTWRRSRRRAFRMWCLCPARSSTPGRNRNRKTAACTWTSRSPSRCCWSWRCRLVGAPSSRTLFGLFLCNKRVGTGRTRRACHREISATQCRTRRRFPAWIHRPSCVVSSVWSFLQFYSPTTRSRTRRQRAATNSCGWCSPQSVPVAWNAKSDKDAELRLHDLSIRMQKAGRGNNESRNSLKCS